jgi:hypothetical protein
LLIIGNPFEVTKTSASLRNINGHFTFVSHIKPKSFLEAKKYNNWILAMQDELNQFERKNVWKLVPRLSNQSIIGTKWVLRKTKLMNIGLLLETKLD